MSLDEFLESIKVKEKPKGLTADLESLWEDAIGNWEAAHEIAQNADTLHGDRIHAYLHRKEGDHFNAQYWYRRLGESMPSESLSEEWRNLVISYLGA